MVTPQPYTVLKATPIHAPKTVTITANTRTHQGQAITTLTINWEQVQGAAAYIVEWRKDDGNWQTMPKVAGQSVDIDGVYGGAYMARVRAVDSFDGESLATSSQLTAIAGKVGRPPRLANLTVQGILFGMNLGWSFNKGSEDTNFTEIEVSPDGRSNITTLGTFAYPTNKHEITGLQGNLTQFYRGRIVDKLGNTSDWTAWASGTTSGDAGKVLDLISGQINGSHLDQTLRTPIAKIGDLQTAVDGVNAQLPTLNSQLATANRELQTAISNITTERNRINTAIRDITALQSANTAKTQELANLTRTVGSHTSAVRDLAVTTGDLSQKYSQLKTATDTANSEITAIKQTQAEQALSVERLGARFDNGNLFKANTATLGHFLDENDSGALKPWGSHRASDFIAVKTNTLYEVRAFDGNFSNLRVIWYDDDKNFVKGQIIARGGDYATFNSENASFVRISSYWTRTDNNVWQMQVAGLASDVNANLETLRQTLTDADIALSQQITAMDTAYKSADTDITARLAREETARANGDNANAQALRTLESTVNGIGGRVGTSEGKIASLERTTSDLNGAIATAQNELNARFDNLTVGGRNLLLNTQALNPLWTRPTSIENGVATFVATGRLLASTQQSDNVQALENGKVTISFTAKSNRDGRLHIRLRRFNTNNQLSDIAQYIAIDSREFKRYSLTLDYSKWTNQERVNFEIATYERAGFVCEVKLPKLEIGTIPTDWTPAPEDLQADIDAKASSASLDEFKRTQAQKDTATAQKLSTLQTTVNGQTTSIRNVERSVDGVRAIKAVTVDNNGVISGYGLMSELQNGRVTSQFGVNADSFFVGSPRNGKKPFATYTQPTVINGVRIPAGTYINTAFIANASITMAKIADSIQSDNYVAGRQGWRLFKDGRFELNNTFGDGSSLELNSKGLIVWYDKARGKKAVELGIFT